MYAHQILVLTMVSVFEIQRYKMEPINVIVKMVTLVQDVNIVRKKSIIENIEFKSCKKCVQSKDVRNVSVKNLGKKEYLH